MTGYVRQEAANIVDGGNVQASHFNNEFNAIQLAFNTASGHGHDGSTAGGPRIAVLGPAGEVSAAANSFIPAVTGTIDLGTPSLKFRDLNISRNALVAGTLGVTGAVTLTSTLAVSGVASVGNGTLGSHALNITTADLRYAAIGGGGGGGTLAIADGGTGATSAAIALINLGAAPLASPALTGNPTAPTQTAGNNTTRLATTAFVTAAVTAGTAGVSSFNSRTGTVTLTGTDVANALTYTPVNPSSLPSASSATPVMNGIAAAGSGTNYSRYDHVHATDTSRAPVASPTFTGTVTLAADPSSALQATTKQYSEAVVGFRNRIMNGDMRIDQLNGGSPVTPTIAATTLDRWRLGITQASKLTVDQQISTLSGHRNSLKVTTAVAASPASSDLYALYQGIEGHNVGDLLWGTASALPIGISFRAKASITGTYAVRVVNSANNRSYVATYALTSGVDTAVGLTIPGDTSGTWLTDTSLGIQLAFDLGSGTNYNTTASAWQAGNYTRTSGCVSMVSTISATLEITGVQLEKLDSTTAARTPFERRPYGSEMALCQRYFQIVDANGGSSASGAGEVSRYPINYPTQMRGTPTTNLTGSANIVSATTETLASVNYRSLRWEFTSSASGSYYIADRVIYLTAEY